MAVLTYIWEKQTNDFNKAQKAVIGGVVSFIFSVGMCAMVLLALDVAK